MVYSVNASLKQDLPIQEKLITTERPAGITTLAKIAETFAPEENEITTIIYGE